MNTYVSYGKIIVMPLCWDLWEPCYFMYYVRLEREYTLLEYELDNKDECGMNNIKKF